MTGPVQRRARSGPFYTKPVQKVMQRLLWERQAMVHRTLSKVKTRSSNLSSTDEASEGATVVLSEGATVVLSELLGTVVLSRLL